MEQDGAGDDRRFRMTFKSAAGQLQDDPRFLIINRGILVNMQHIRNMTIPSCFMDDGTVFPVNRRKAALLQKTYKKWLLSSWVKRAGKALSPFITGIFYIRSAGMVPTILQLCP